MAHWLVVIGDDRYAAERLYHHDVLEIGFAGPDAGDGYADLKPGDAVAVAAGEPLRVFALGKVTDTAAVQPVPDAPAAPGGVAARAAGEEWDPDASDRDVVERDASERGAAGLCSAHSGKARSAQRRTGPAGGAVVAVGYTHRMVDEPVPWRGAPASPDQPVPLDAVEYAALADQVAAEYAVDAPRRSWLVGVDLPIEASTPAEAVRQFWSYVTRLGPRELPTFVAPVGDELAMQAYVLGERANLDPEEED